MEILKNLKFRLKFKYFIKFFPKIFLFLLTVFQNFLKNFPPLLWFSKKKKNSSLLPGCFVPGNNNNAQQNHFPKIPGFPDLRRTAVWVPMLHSTTSAPPSTAETGAFATKKVGKKCIHVHYIPLLFKFALNSCRFLRRHARASGWQEWWGLEFVRGVAYVIFLDLWISRNFFR